MSFCGQSLPVQQDTMSCSSKHTSAVLEKMSGALVNMSGALENRAGALENRAGGESHMEVFLNVCDLARKASSLNLLPFIGQNETGLFCFQAVFVISVGSGLANSGLLQVHFSTQISIIKFSINIMLYIIYDKYVSVKDSDCMWVQIRVVE